jgi:hypothetical protein
MDPSPSVVRKPTMSGWNSLKVSVQSICQPSPGVGMPSLLAAPPMTMRWCAHRGTFSVFDERGNLDGCRALQGERWPLGDRAPVFTRLVPRQTSCMRLHISVRTRAWIICRTQPRHQLLWWNTSATTSLMLCKCQAQHFEGLFKTQTSSKKA